MAPKGGRGGGGGGRGGSGGSVSCSSDAFHEIHPIVIIAFAALFLVVWMVMGCLVPGTKTRNRKNLQPPGTNRRSWGVLGCAIWLQVLGTIMFIAGISVIQCDGSNQAGPDLQIARLWFEGLAILCIFGLILISVCKDLHNVSGSLLPKLVTLGHSIYFGLLVLLEILSLVLLTIMSHPPDSADPSDLEGLPKASKGLTATFDVLAILGMLIAGASLIVALLRGPKLGFAKIWVLLLIFSSVALTLVEFAFFAHFSLQSNWTTPVADIVYYVLRSLLFSITFLSILFIKRSPSVASGEASEGTTAVPQAAAPQQQPLMGQDPNATKPPFNTNVNTSYQPQYDQNHQLPYDPNYPPPPQNNNMTYSAPYNNGNYNVNYTPVSAPSPQPPPPQPYYNQ